jgi:magnesium-transporting ATPase (P-type)
MSVIVKDEFDQIHLFCKGADSIMIPRFNSVICLKLIKKVLSYEESDNFPDLLFDFRPKNSGAG